MFADNGTDEEDNSTHNILEIKNLVKKFK